MTRIGIFKKIRSGRSLYIITAKTLQELYKRFFAGGFGGLKTKVIYSESNPPSMQVQLSRILSETEQYRHGAFPISFNMVARAATDFLASATVSLAHTHPPQ
ncbi:MAG: hypothetical protein QXX99_00075 [Candidatus Bathyarchaeia archaeon]